MHVSNKILSDITIHSKYARFNRELNRRETWDEICLRNMNMHLKKYPFFKDEIEEVYRESVVPKKLFPSMRSLQFAGAAIEKNPTRIYNCAYLPIEDIAAFSETMFLLLSGTGVGYSVQSRHVDNLPIMVGPSDKTRKYLIGDSIEGWADAVKVLVESYFFGKARVRFSYDDIREKGTELITSGGKAPGPEPLRECLQRIEQLLNNFIGRKLSPIVSHDIQCLLADAVLAGGIRRAAMISLFDKSDDEMINCKSGEWWIDNPQRARANNSVVLLRGETSKDEFDALWERVRLSGAGEPGFYWTNNLDWGTNPCCEIALRPYQFCNLTEINATDIKDQADFNRRARDAAFLGTLQAGYTDFHYLRPIWKQTTEEDALVGVGMTGIASNAIEELNEEEAAHVARCTNYTTATLLGINVAARVTTVKPSGTSSLVAGSSSGIHGWHAPHYIRRMRFGKDESIYKYLAKQFPEFVEDEYFRPESQAVISIPQKAPGNASFRTESPLTLLERVKRYNLGWVRVGHNRGDNTNNVSCTISLRDNEWNEVGEWMWENRNTYNGISVLPFDGGSYKQMPFEDCTEEEYDALASRLTDIDLTKVTETNDETNLAAELACSGGACEIDFGNLTEK